MKQYDVVINGAGMVGAVTALLLAAQPASKDWSIAVIESKPQTKYDPLEKHQLRVSAISKHNLELFERLALTEFLHQQRMGVYSNMLVWDNHSTGEIDFNNGSNQILGAMTENNQIIAAAQNKLVKHPQIEVFFNTAIESFDQNDRQSEVNT